MPIPTRAELRAAFAEAMAKQFSPTDPAAAAAAIYAAVAVVLPDEAELDCYNTPLPDLHRQAERYRTQIKFFALIDALGGGANDQEHPILDIPTT
jgi:hypothetical protein